MPTIKTNPDVILNLMVVIFPFYNGLSDRMVWNPGLILVIITLDGLYVTLYLSAKDNLNLDLDEWICYVCRCLLEIMCSKKRKIR